jgi:NADH-quinone oxidoreductase subunit L
MPLVLLAIPSLVIGFVAIDAMLFGDFFKNVIFVDAARHPAMQHLREHYHGAVAMGLHGFVSLPFLLMVAGVVLAWFFYLVRPDIPAAIKARLSFINTVLENKYYLDRINEVVFAGGARLLGRGLWKVADQGLIDGLIVNGSARVVGWVARASRLLQTGYIYHYAFAMLVGVAIVLFFFLTLPYVWPALTR